MPTFTTVPLIDQTVHVGATLTFIVAVNDFELQPIIITMTPQPTWLTTTGNTFTGTPP